MCNPPSLDSIPVRKTGKVEIAFKSPGPQPNGLQATKDGLSIIDQSAGSRVYLVDYADGRVLRSFETDTVRPSGITFDGEALWIGSTFSYENVRCNATTGAVMERRPTPGSIMYTMAGDPPSVAARSRAVRSRKRALPLVEAGAPPLARLMQAPSNRLQGAHGQEWREGHSLDDVNLRAIDLPDRGEVLGRAEDFSYAREIVHTASHSRDGISGTATRISRRFSSTTPTQDRSWRRFS